ncbi:MAG: four helix bundle protein [Planctomycetota bacterium]
MSGDREYDLETRTLTFAKRTRAFVKGLPKTVDALEDGKQVIRASGSVGANYIEANEALSKKDFLMRLRICRKEAKECRYWFDLLDSAEGDGREHERRALRQEAHELMLTFGAMLRNAQEGTKDANA